MKDYTQARYVFVGAGAMGSAIIAGLANSPSFQGEIYAYDPALCDRDPQELHLTGMLSSLSELTSLQPDVVLLAVKPQVISTVARDLAAYAATGKSLFISIAAGITLEQLSSFLGSVRLVRAMPNLPAQIQCGATALAPAKGLDDADIVLARGLFAQCGVAEVMTEEQLEIAGAVAGCGPAFVALFVDAFTRAANLEGLPSQVARNMIQSTVAGTSEMLLASHEHPRSYMEKVMSPGGTTAAALRAFEPACMSAATQAVHEALRRTHELAALEGGDSA